MLALCPVSDLDKWLQVFEVADSQRLLKKAVIELLPALEPYLPDIFSQKHEPQSLEPVIRDHISVGNYQLLVMLQDRFQLVSAATQLPYWCLCNLMRQYRIPPYISQVRSPTELQDLIQRLGMKEKLRLLDEIGSNTLPLQLQGELLNGLLRSGCKEAKNMANIVEQKLGLFDLIEGKAAQRQVFESVNTATLVQTLLDFLQEGETINWESLFQSPQIFALAREALIQTVQLCFNREPLDQALAGIVDLLEANLPPTALAEIYTCSISRLTQEKDTMFAARLGRLLERHLSEFMTVSDRQLVASLNTAVAMEICELCMQGKLELATARCAVYEGNANSADVEGLRRFLEARAGLPFARDALEKLGAEKGWRSYLKLFGR